jgi:hypothetical protein
VDDFFIVPFFGGAFFFAGVVFFEAGAFDGDSFDIVRGAARPFPYSRL